MLKFKKMTKVERLIYFKNLSHIIFGSIMLAFGTALFLTKLNIVAGGLSGIGIVLQYFFGSAFFGGQLIDIFVFIMTWLLWILGAVTLGKEFALKTLVSSIVYPLCLAIFLRVPFFIELSESIAYYGMTGDIAGQSVPIGNLIICGVFGGFFIGVGCAFNFLGGGSSGGTDVLVALARKYLGIKESIFALILDAVIIVCGMFIIPSNIVPSLNGIISACVTCLMIEYFYIGKQTSYQADIISDKWEEISRFVQDVMGRGATIIHSNGGYKGDNRIILRVVFDKSQLRDIRDFIAATDPKAFMTFTPTFGVYGEGFNKHNTKLTKYNKNKKDDR